LPRWTSVAVEAAVADSLLEVGVKEIQTNVAFRKS
jgi:hypothetical protein